jgi:RNA exonuclease 1
MLDDTSAPSWIEVRNKSFLRACVVILVPGLCPETFNIDTSRGSEGKRRRRVTEIQPCPLPNMAEIFGYMWFPKAPGTNTQVYSPVSSFLNCPLTASQNLRRAKQQSKQKGTKM